MESSATSNQDVMTAYLERFPPEPYPDASNYLGPQNPVQAIVKWEWHRLPQLHEAMQMALDAKEPIVDWETFETASQKSSAPTEKVSQSTSAPQA